MAKIKNVSGVDRHVPALDGRLVVAGAVLEVEDGDVYGFTCQVKNWSPHDAAAKKAHESGQAAELEAQNPTHTPEPEAPTEKEND